MSKLRDVCVKYREELFGHIERNLCLEHYNSIFKTEYKEGEVEMHQSRCRFCNEEKLCVVHSPRS